MIIQGEQGKQRLVHYEFDRASTPIGVGGMGVVYKGQMVYESTGAVRDVAIKEVTTDADATQRMLIIEQAEREASIRIMNDNLIEMIDFVEVQERKFGTVKSKYYVISEFLHGVTLDKILKDECVDYEGKIVPYAQEISKRYKLDPDDTACLITRNVLSGIMALHDKGYLHRDIDPSNIMITDDGKIKIIDFGIAKQANSLSISDGLKEGEFVGKVEYAAPELISGDVSIQDYSTDIYEIGVLFYRLLCGRLPFEGNRFEIMKGHQQKKPDLSLIKNAKNRGIVAKAMQKNPQKRYRTSAEMRVALDGASPAPKWVWPILVGALMAVVVVAFAVALGVNKDKKWLRNNGGTVVDTVGGHEVEMPEPAPPIEKDTLTVASILSDGNPEIYLDAQPDNPAVLFATAVKVRKRGYDSNPLAQRYWNEVLVPSGDVDKYLVITTPSSVRFAYVACSRARAHIDDYKYAPAAKEGLLDKIEVLLAELKKTAPDALK